MATTTFIDIPEWPCDLTLLPEGAYITPETKTDMAFDVISGKGWPSVEWRKVVRIDPGTDSEGNPALLPSDSLAYFRKDGCRVWEAWMILPALDWSTATHISCWPGALRRVGGSEFM